MARKITPTPTVPDLLDPMTYVPPSAPATWVGTGWLDSFANLSGELTAFAADRWIADVQVSEQLLRCRTVQEVQHVQATFVQKMIDQYHAEMARLYGLAGRVAADMQAGAA